MIDPRTTNIVGQRVVFMERSDTQVRKTFGRGIVRVVDYQHGDFTLLIEAVETIEAFGVHDGGLFQITLAHETVEIIVDHEVPVP